MNAGVAAYSGKNAPAVDLVGAVRPQGGSYDIGAYEYMQPTAIAEQNDTLSITVFPNPCIASFTLKMSEMLDNAQLKIYDVCGREVKTIAIPNAETIIEREELENGVYFYNLINDNSFIGKGKLLLQ